MQTLKARQPREILNGLFLLVHPGPVALHLLAVSLFVLLASWPSFNWPTILLLVSAHTAMQVAIAIHNDYADRLTDAQGQKKKPIPLGLVTPREALLGTTLCIALMFLLLLPLNHLALLISILYLALGLSYNLGLKSTPFSGIVFALAIPLIPVYAFVGVGRILPILPWFVPTAALLGVALNLANSLPDLEEDKASGLHTLAVVLGLSRSYALCTLCVLASAILIACLSLTHIVPANPLLILPAILIACPGILTAYVYFKGHQARNLRQRYFPIVVYASLLLAVGWILGVLF
jgi:4-hydroxybenzoate polyprenyltransferase